MCAMKLLNLFKSTVNERMFVIKLFVIIRHMRIHTNRDVCKKRYRHSDGLKYHMRIHTTTTTAFRQHLKTKNNEDRTCDVCERDSRTKRHMRNVQR